MKKLLLLVMAFVIMGWAIPKPMESLENYNVMLLHGAYGAEKGWKNRTQENRVAEAYYATAALDSGAALGRYYEKPDDDPRLLHWLSTKILEEPEMSKDSAHPKYSHIYQWRSFSNPANSSYANAFELGDRTWSKPNTIYKHRRALVEEAQEVKSSFYSVAKDDSLYGQEALDSIRKNSDLYRQIASRYILIGHSMGGVVAREYVQNSDYYHGDVDKVITLDSPHEGTGSLNMLLDMTNIGRSAEEGVMSSLSLIATTSLIIWATSKNIEFLNVAGLGLSLSMNAALMNLGIGTLVSLKLENYETSDSLVCYVDPDIANNYFCNGNEPSINDLRRKINVADSMPMFRMLAGEHSMVFTDPKKGLRNAFSLIIPDAVTVPFVNLFSQLTLDNGSIANYANAWTAMFLGLFSGVNVQEHGSALVETKGGLALGTKMFTDYGVDVKRKTFNAAYEVSESGVSTIIELTLAYGVFAAVAASSLILGPGGDAIKMGIGTAIALSLMPSIEVAIAAGFMDLAYSHQYPLYKEHQERWKIGVSEDGVDESKMNSFTSIASGQSLAYPPYLMEDFLYEKPFINLALSDSRTMDSLANNPEWNPNCYFESDSLQKEPLCEVGLYGARDSIIVDAVTNDTTHVYNSAVARVDSNGNAVYDSVYYGSYKKLNYSEFRNNPLKFKAESDWYKVGVKVDRWERVDGLKPNGDPAPKGVPIRHVERYSVPDIVVDGYIEKYSFVVDDLMPHRMRQIKMTFNSKEEIAWECNVTKAEDDPTACAVYTRKVGDSWGDPDTIVAHPIKKNGRFDFDASKYFSNLANIQKDNQNTVMISMVNKIGLSNTQRFYV